MNLKQEEVFFVCIKLIILTIDLFFDIFMDTGAMLNKLQKIKDLSSREYDASNIIISKLTSKKKTAEERADKAEERADKAEARADKAEARADKAEAKLRALVELGLHIDEDRETEAIDNNGAMPHFCFKVQDF